MGIHLDSSHIPTTGITKAFPFLHHRDHPGPTWSCLHFHRLRPQPHDQILSTASLHTAIANSGFAGPLHLHLHSPHLFLLHIRPSVVIDFIAFILAFDQHQHLRQGPPHRTHPG